MKIESKKNVVNATSSKIFQLVSNFNNFGSSLPKEVQNWQSTENKCSFEISGMAKINIEIIDKKEFSQITYKASANQPIGMIIIGHINEIGDSCEVSITLEADVPMALSMMVKTPLQNFVNVLVDRVKEVSERS